MRCHRVLAALSSAALVVLSACSSSVSGRGEGAGAAPPGSPTAPASTAATPSPTAPSSAAPATSTNPATSSPSTSPTTSGAPSSPVGNGNPNSWCGSSQIAVTSGGSQGATGHMSVVLRFVNVSPHACILYGFPGVDGLDSHGRTVVHAKRTYDGFMGGCNCSSLHGVRVGPGQTASAVVEGDNGGAGPPRCSRVKSLLVTPPNTYRSTPVRESLHNCDFQVHPVVSGSNGQG